MSDRPLTSAETLVLDAFVDLELANGGWTPTLEEIGDHIGIGRPTVHAHAQRLVGLGLLEYRLTLGGKARYRACRDTLERARLASATT
jgi:DNA-binding MarR family transcriptional regulator